MKIRLLNFALAAIALSGAVACNEDVNRLRSEVIEVCLSDDLETPVSQVEIAVEGESLDLYIRSNVSWDMAYEQSLSDTERWITISDPRNEGGWDIVTITANPMKATDLSARKGTLKIWSEENCLGSFITLVQGYTPIFSEDFSWLTYEDARLMSGWSSMQKEQGYISTLLEGSTDAWVYGCDGYVVLGNNAGGGADLVFPFVETMRTYPAALVSLNVAALPDGAQSSPVSLELLGGGRFYPDGTTKKTFEAVDLGDKWKEESLVSFYVTGATIDTRLRVISCNMNQSEPFVPKEDQPTDGDAFAGDVPEIDMPQADTPSDGGATVGGVPEIEMPDSGEMPSSDSTGSIDDVPEIEMPGAPLDGGVTDVPEIPLSITRSAEAPVPAYNRIFVDNVKIYGISMSYAIRLGFIEKEEEVKK